MMEGLKDLALLPDFRLGWLESLGEYVYIFLGQTHYLLHFKNGLYIVVCFYSVSPSTDNSSYAMSKIKKKTFIQTATLINGPKIFIFYHFLILKMIKSFTLIDLK